jgi:ABC-type lipoprotein export system ATPase subunit
MAENQIECISLTKQYSGKKNTVTAVDNINMSIRKSELVLLKGRSGAGKSTLLSLMCGLIKPTHGKVMIENECISEMADNSLSRLLSKKIGIIYQGFNLLPTYTVYENIEIALVPGGLDQSLVKDNIYSLLKQFNLAEKSELMPSELSAGQQQKVAIIRSLIKQPSVIFADEPTGSVDDETAQEILEHLMYLKNEKQVTIVVATHGNILEMIADSVFVIENGRIKDSESSSIT